MSCPGNNFVTPGAGSCSGELYVVPGADPCEPTTPPKNVVTLPVFAAPTYVAINGGGLPTNFGNITGLPFVNPFTNPTVQFTLTMSGIGSQIPPGTLGNDIYVGIFDSTTLFVMGYIDSGTPLDSVAWGNAIPSGNNYIVNLNIPYLDYVSKTFYYGIFISYPYGISPFYQFSDLSYQLRVSFEI